MFRIAQFIVGFFMKIFFPTKVVGKQNLPKTGSIISCNHISNLDAILFATNTWEKKYYLTKKEWFKNKLLGAFMKSIGCIKIDRQSTDVTAIKNCLKVLKSGKKLIIFPEGTRNKNADMELGEVKQGVSMLAIKAKVPKMFHKTIITIGEPFELDAFYGQKANEEVLSQASKLVAEKMKLLQEQVTEIQNKKKEKRKKKIKKEA